MKALSSYTLVVALGLFQLSRAHDENELSDQRLCPDGYRYAGDDSPSVNKDNWEHEVERSPVYSCYKIVLSEADWPTANMKCIHDQNSQLVSFEDQLEMDRFAMEFFKPEGDLKSLEVLTSALHFGSMDSQGWMWIGSNKTIPGSLLQEADGLMDNQCLVLHMSRQNRSYLKPVDCLEKQSFFVCETRVQTVTYYTWFISNWLTVFLVFVLSLLVISLCVMVAMYSNKTTRRERIYRQAHLARGNVEDLPPTYNEVAGVSGPQESRFQHYRQRGREILARVYFTRDESKTIPTH